MDSSSSSSSSKDEITQNVLQKGQKIAACVPYHNSEPKYEWILAVVVSYQKENNYYTVKDLFPENRRARSWKVPSYKVIQFPGQTHKFNLGDKVLSLWYLPDTNEWSSMFYKANVVALPEGENVKVQFHGDEELYDIEIDKVVKKPKKPKGKRGIGSIGTTSKRQKRTVMVKEEPKEQFRSSIGLSDMDITKINLHKYHLCGVLGKKIRRREAIVNEARNKQQLRS